MPAKVQLLRSTTNSIYRNLALEEALWASQSEKPLLFLWRNSPTVVIGRHQNAWKECSLGRMEEANVALARRYSGGGAVYHDLGCTVFTFINRLDVPGESVSRVIDRNFDILTRSLNALGLNVSRKGRNDLLLDGEVKVSGSAFKQSQHALIHHGTILVNSDLSKLATFLTPSKIKLESKGIASVRSRVCNLADFQASLDHETVSDSLINQFRREYECASALDPTPIDDEMQSNPLFQDHYTKLSDWSWRYGSSPEFSHLMETRIDGIGCFEVHYNVVYGKIKRIKIFSDVLYPDVVDVLQGCLTGVEYRRDQLAQVLTLSIQEFRDSREKQTAVDEFGKWFIASIAA